MIKHTDEAHKNIEGVLVRVKTKTSQKWEKQFRDMMFGVRIWTETSHKICLYGSYENLPEFSMNDNISFKLRFYVDVIRANKYDLWEPKPEKYPFVSVGFLDYDRYKELTDDQRNYHFGPSLTLSVLDHLPTLANLTDTLVGYQSFNTSYFTVPMEHPKAREIEYRHMELFVMNQDIIDLVS